MSLAQSGRRLRLANPIPRSNFRYSKNLLLPPCPLCAKLCISRNTVEKIVSHWAPPSENNTEKYITNVEKWSGIPRSMELSLSDGADYMMIVAAMSAVENGVNANILDVREGFNLQTKITIP